ncbi:MAG: vitamin K epoxide reductase family protein [Dehalococcoidia bacterium]|nr:vitamin K epoxide reductase family protein [Dehalococcoidia bacterium]
MPRLRKRGTNSGVHPGLQVPVGWARVAIVACALAGMVATGYLTVAHFTHSGLVCLVGSGCDAVQSSAYATIAGVPVALVGLLGYGVILLAVVGRPRLRNQGLWLYAGALAGFVFSTYLTFVELFVIRAVCSYCIFSYGLITLILVLFLVANRGAGWLLVFKRYLPLTAGIVVVVLTLSWGLQRNADQSVQEETPGSFAATLAQHLTDRGVVMYGGFRCPHCATQKAMFGDAFRYVRYVECDPSGKNADPLLCAQKRINAYPTWEIGGRFYQGVLSLERLASLSGFTAPQP